MVFYVGRYKGIEKKEFEVEVITPLFLGGADPRMAELRVPPIKGALRFWWRALHPHLTFEELKRREAEIFGTGGDNGGKSKVKISIRKGLTFDDSSRVNPLPHKEAKFTFPCFKPGQTFSIELYGDIRVVNLFRLFTILGGLGKRSRRGFGSIKILEREEDHENQSLADKIQRLIGNISGTEFEISGHKIIRADSPERPYPFIKEIHVGSTAFENSMDLLAKIGAASHTYKSDHTGYAKGKRRFSSPIYVSVIHSSLDESFRPIITRLNTAFDPNFRPSGRDKSNDFIDNILGLGGAK